MRTLGSVYQIARSGKWVAAITTGYDSNNRPIRKTRLFGTPEEAEMALAQMLIEQQRGTLPPTERLSVETYLAHWLADVIKPNVRANSYVRYESIVRLHICPHIGRINLQKLRAPDVQRMINANKLTLAPATVAQVLTVLSQALTQAVKWDLVSRNVAALVDRPRVPSQAVQALDAEQARKLLAQVKGERLEALYVLALATGLRRGELLGLRWQDVDLDAGALVVSGQLQRVGKEQKRVVPKTSSSIRRITLSAGVVRALHAHKARQLAERARAGANWQDEPYVFRRPNGAPLLGMMLWREFKAHLRAAGLPPVRFHALRATALSLLLADGVPANTVAAIAGHTGVAMTLNRYGKSYPSAQVAAADALERLLGGLK